MDEQQPGTVIGPAPQQVESPAGGPVSETTDQVPSATATLGATAIQPPASIDSTAAVPAVTPTGEAEVNLSAYASQPIEADLPDLSWVASEYMHTERGAGWYMVYIFAISLLGVLVWFITKDYISSGIVLIASLGLIYVIARKPRDQAYALHDGNMAIGKRWYALKDFKSFSVDEEAQSVGITLLPLKRFMPPVTVYLNPSDKQPIVDYLSQYLPFEIHKPDAVDALLRRLRF